jgi:hypothetical protein
MGQQCPSERLQLNRARVAQIAVVLDALTRTTPTPRPRSKTLPILQRANHAIVPVDKEPLDPEASTRAEAVTGSMPKELDEGMPTPRAAQAFEKWRTIGYHSRLAIK